MDCPDSSDLSYILGSRNYSCLFLIILEERKNLEKKNLRKCDRRGQLEEKLKLYIKLYHSSILLGLKAKGYPRFCIRG